MKKIKSYEEFNEEINFKKSLDEAALGAGLAFGSPSQAAAKEPVKTEMTQSQSTVVDDISQVIHVDSTMRKADIQKVITGQLANMKNVSIVSSTPDKIVCNLNLSSKPDNSSGYSYGKMEISFKDGKYKIDFYDIYFDYMGEQPTTDESTPLKKQSVIGQTLKNQAGQIATSVVTSQIRNPILRGVVGQTMGTAVRNANNPPIQTRVQTPQVDKSNLTYQQALIDNSSFADSIFTECEKIVDNLQSGFNKSSEDNW